MLDTALIEEYFPFDKCRPGQKECIEAILNAYNDGKRFVILEAPTGSGKSVIGMTVAKFFSNSYYLTIQKILQDQLMRDFASDMTRVLKGRNAYKCDYWEKWAKKHNVDISEYILNISDVKYRDRVAELIFNDKPLSK